jgi:integrase
MPKSTKSRARSKPPPAQAEPIRGGKSTKAAKPRFPLFRHQSGRWAKKIRGRFNYFGAIAPDPGGTAALARFTREWPYLKDGRTPPPVDLGDGCTVDLLCNAFLTNKRELADSGELTERAFADYYRTCAWLVDQVGKHRRVDDLRPDDFAKLRAVLAKGRAATTLKGEINRIRVLLKFAFDERLIDRPVHYGQSFDRPSAKTLRRARNAAGSRMFERDELLLILDAIDGKPLKIGDADEPLTLTPDPQLKAMILLGLNCGFGNTDVARLPRSAVDLNSGWIDYPRPKTEIRRRIPLWTETAQAMADALAVRPKPKSAADADCWFLTRTGKRWVRMQARKKTAATEAPALEAVDPLSQRFKKVMTAVGVGGRRSFYGLRHTHETIGGEAKDQVALNAIMGHVDASMAAVYRERVSDERLRAVVNTVHQWLWPPPPKPESAATEEGAA